MVTENPFSIIERRLNRNEDLLLNVLSEISEIKKQTQTPAESKLKKITVAELLASKQISRRTLYKLFKEGKLSKHKLGSRTFVDADEWNSLFHNTGNKK